MTFYKKAGILGVIVAALAACSDGERSTPRLLDSDAKNSDRATEDERLRRMQLVRVINDQTGVLEELEAGDFVTTVISQHCPRGGQNRAAFCIPAIPGPVCEQRLCDTGQFRCAGEILLGIAEGTGTSLTLKRMGQSEPYDVRVPPQPAAVSAALALEAARFFRASMFQAGVALSQRAVGTIDACTGGHLATTWVDRPVHAFLASAFINSFQSGKEAFRVAYENTLAVADAELSSTPSLELARQRAISKRALSRMAAAHLMVGGEPGFLGATDEAFCPTGRLSGPEAKALAVFRESALSPADVLNDDIPIEALVGESAAGPQPASGSVRERLGDIWGTTAIPSNRPIWDIYGLRPADFDVARLALKDELTIFARSETAQLQPRILEEGREALFPRWAATAGIPPERDHTYWAALAASKGMEPIVPLSEFREPSLLQALHLFHPLGAEWGFTLAEFTDAAFTWAGDVLRRPELQPESPTAPSGILESVFRPFGLLLGSDEYRGRFVQCLFRHPEDPERLEQRLSALGYTRDDNLIVVRGEDLLQCATSGAIEGASCSLPDFTSQFDIFPDAAVSPDPEILRLRTETPNFAFGPFESEVSVTVPDLPGDTGRWYVLAPKLKGNVNPGPGEWKALTGVTLYDVNGSTGDLWCRDIPIVPEAIELASKAIQPSREWCGASQVSCAGVNFDERLPLEDELTDDQSGVESSWRHYLTLARAAATEADALGQEFIQAALQEDFRKEELDLRRIAREEKAAGELQRLQEICGTSVDPAPLLKLLGRDEQGNFNLSATDFGPCCVTPPPVPGTCIPRNISGTTCVGGRLLGTIVAPVSGPGGFSAVHFESIPPELVKLRNCVAGFDQQREMHLGNASVCIRRDGQVTFESEAECQTLQGEFLSVADGLSLFDTRSVLPKEPLPEVCDAIRVLRATPGAKTSDGTPIVSVVTDGRYFSQDELDRIRRSIDMRLDYNGYVTVNFGDSTFTTGTPGGPAQTGWPCGGPTSCPAGSEGLFCRRWDCASPQSRAEINLRLYNAAVTAKLSTWKPGGQGPEIEIPYYLNAWLSPYQGNSQGTLNVNNAQIKVRANSRWRLYEAPGGLSVNHHLAHALGDQSWSAVGPRPQDVEPHPILLSEDNQPMRFAIRREAVDVGNGYRDQFWAGVAAGDPSSAPGIVMKLLLGEPVSISQTQRLFRTALVPCESPLGTTCQTTAGQRDRITGLKLEVISLHKLPLARVAGSGDHAVLGFQLYPPTSEPLPNRPDDGAFKFERQGVLDGLELMCEGAVATGRRFRAGCDLQSPIDVKSVDQFVQLGERLQCIGDEIIRRAAMSRYLLPEAALEDLFNATTGDFSATGGQMPIAISELRNALLEVATSGPIVGGTVGRFGQDLRALRHQLARYQNSAEMSRLRLGSQQAQQISNCVAALASGLTLANLGGGTVAGVATCGNSLAQIGFAIELQELEAKDLMIARDQAIAEFNGRAIEYKTTLDVQSIRLSQALETVQRQLQVIEGLKAEARRAVQSALWQLSAQAGNEGEITNVLGNIKQGARIRYKRALTSAKRMAFLAKRAIEQRLGMSLADMVENLPLVTAPAGWEATVCATTGIDYNALRTSGQGENFADKFIGDYVTKLEQVVESYRLVNNFHEGTDTAVISLRDDVHNVRTECDVESRNLLYFASSLDSAVVPLDQSVLGWAVTGCGTELVDAGDDEVVERVLPDCIAITPRQDAPFFDPDLGQRPVRGHTLKFGAEDCTPETCGFRPDAALGQELELTGGRYRFSWYTLDEEGGGGAHLGSMDPSTQPTPVVRRADGTLIAVPTTRCSPTADRSEPCFGFIAGEDGDWNRVYFTFDVLEEGLHRIGFQRPNAGTSEITIAAPMLELLEDPLGERSLPEPPPFTDTTAERTTRLQVCEDTTGERFRADKWDRNCLILCPDGYQSDCRSSGRKECFWETSFHISQRGIEAGHIFNQSGFARGNFNYRIESVAANFVGTGLRQCKDSNLPSTCHAAGFIPYSIIHAGPYYVRNHQGQDYRAHLFTGQIEHARGLGNERYITNPVGDADRTLLEPYLRRELNGRPLDGEFILRIWDEPGVNFHAIQDVQLVLNYRYWTRFK